MLPRSFKCGASLVALLVVIDGVGNMRVFKVAGDISGYGYILLAFIRQVWTLRLTASRSTCRRIVIAHIMSVGTWGP